MLAVKVDPEVKQNVQDFAREIGIPLSSLVNAYFRHLLRTREVTFTDSHKMKPELEEMVGEVIEDIKHNRNLSPAFSTAEEMDAYLDNL